MKIPESILASCIALGVVACSNIIGSEETPTPYNQEDPLKAGEISLPVKPDPTFNWAPQPGVFDLGGLKTRAGGEPVLVVLGESVAAGYRDGGLFREGQITSYPNLVARQMGLTNFKQPLFEREHGNGTGRLVVDEDTKSFRWKEVTNNLAYKEKNSFIEFNPFMGQKVNNFSVPGYHPVYYGHKASDLQADATAYFQNNPLPAEKANTNYLWDKYSMPIALASRFMPSDVGTGWDQINNLNPDLGIVDVGLDIFVTTHLRGGGNGLQDSQRSPTWELQMLDKLKKTGMKYVYTTVPDVLDFPYFKLFTYASIFKKTGSVPNVLADGHAEHQALRPGDILLPTANVANYFDGKLRSTFTDADVIRLEETGRPEWYNRIYVQRWAKEYNHPLVDFYSVYKKILAGQYISEDGFKIDPSFPDGNFFSSDGIYPSAIGQAVLANEVIKVFNTSYRMQIPLINIGVYAAEIGKN